MELIYCLTFDHFGRPIFKTSLRSFDEMSRKGKISLSLSVFAMLRVQKLSLVQTRDRRNPPKSRKRNASHHLSQKHEIQFIENIINWQHEKHWIKIMQLSTKTTCLIRVRVVRAFTSYLSLNISNITRVQKYLTGFSLFCCCLSIVLQAFCCPSVFLKDF